MTHSRVSWMLAPVDRSMAVSAPQIVLHCSFSTSCRGSHALVGELRMNVQSQCLSAGDGTCFVQQQGGQGL